MTTIPQWLEVWQRAKDLEDDAKAERLGAELEILALLAKPETFKGTVKLDGFEVTYGESVKVDAVTLKAVFEAATDEQKAALEALFRWKPELDAKAFKAASEETKRAIMRTFETKPSKPSFSRKEK